MKFIEGYEGLYAIDQEGEVWSLVNNSSRRKGKLKHYINESGYHRVNLYDKDGKVKKYYVHRLVAITFLDNPNNYPAVNHISANKDDNSIKNLEWCDAKYNVAESRRLGLQKDKKVQAMSIITGELRNYNNIKDAAVDIAGKDWAFQYLRKNHGNKFYHAEWRIEVMPL